MGIISKIITANVSAWAQNVDSFTVFEGILYSTILIATVSNAEGNDYFADISIMDNEASQYNRSASLVSGFLGTANPLGWTGRHPLITDNLISVVWYAPANAQLKLQWLQLMPSDKLTAKQVLDA